MKKFMMMVALAATMTMAAVANNEQTREDVSWQAFCKEYGYAVTEKSDAVIDYYLDTWVGSAKEEKALIAAGMEIR